MAFWRWIRYLLLGLVDALWPPVLALLVVWVVLPIRFFTRIFPYALGFAGFTFVVALGLGIRAARRGGKPFPVTRKTWELAKHITSLWWI
jgi:predicted lysophospholipase L1 biosynthesis ABC-type transport system permease subunit